MRIATVCLCVVLVTAGIAVVVRAGDDGEAAKVERGRYLVELAGCGHCHTPMKMGPKGPEHDHDRMWSGHPSGLELPPPPAMGAGPWNAMTGGMIAPPTAEAASTPPAKGGR